MVGYLVVLASVFGEYALMGGHFGVLFQPLELLMIGGAALATVGIFLMPPAERARVNVVWVPQPNGFAFAGAFP